MAHISAVTVLVPDYDAGIEFYVGKLGFSLISDTALGPTKRWVLVAPPGGQTRLLLAQAEGPAQFSAVGNQTGGRVGFFLETTDFGKDHATMTANGVHFLEEPRSEPYGQVAVFEDPFGNRWDLIQFST